MTSAQALPRRVVLRRYPTGALGPSDFEVESYESPALEDGQFRVRNIYVSVEPMLRITIDPAPLGGAFAPLPLGAVVPGPAVGEVVESRNPAFAVGQLVEGRFGWQDLAVSSGAGVIRVGPDVRPIVNALGAFGLPGFSAFVGLHRLGGLRPGQTVLISGAAGAVGSIAGALVRARGGRAVGIAGGQAKRAYLLDTVGYEAVADRSAADFVDQLKHALPNGADVYFDNVGGPLMATVAPLMARGGRILICGLMAQYQHDESSVDHLPAVLEAVMSRGLTIEAFSNVGQDALRPEFEREMAELIRTGRLKPEVHVEEGLERLPAALCGLFENSRTGKVVVRIAPEPSSAGAPARVEEKA